MIKNLRNGLPIRGFFLEVKRSLTIPRVIKQDTKTTCRYKRKSVYAKDSTKVPHTIKCSRHAYYTVDLIPMCKTHAGNYLLNEQLPPEDREGEFIKEKTPCTKNTSLSKKQ